MLQNGKVDWVNAVGIKLLMRVVLADYSFTCLISFYFEFEVYSLTTLAPDQPPICWI